MVLSVDQPMAHRGISASTDDTHEVVGIGTTGSIRAHDTMHFSKLHHMHSLALCQC